jgi:hypothetical protein
MSRVSLWPVLRTTNFLCSVDAFYARSLKHRVGIRPDVFHDVIFAIVNLPFCFEPKVLVLPFGTTRRLPTSCELDSVFCPLDPEMPLVPPFAYEVNGD